ncbi:MAG: hypothetical protein ACE5FF_03740 [Saprospiraceae bacterium]
MNGRKFKPGDKVQQLNGGPVMQVLNYIFEYNPWVGNYRSYEQVECWWVEGGQRKAKVFPQKKLNAVIEVAALLPVSEEALRQREN